MYSIQHSVKVFADAMTGAIRIRYASLISRQKFHFVQETRTTK